MGTLYTISIINQSNKRIDVQLLQNQIDSLLIEINNIFSNYINSSEISNINRHLSTSTINISFEMNEVINTAIQIYELSNGKFDITIKPLVDIWGFGENYDTSQFPSDELIKKTKEYVGFEKLVLKNNTLKKSNKLIQIDLNAIAKGWGVDKVSEFIHKSGFNRYMVEIGGEISVLGKNQYSVAPNQTIRPSFFAQYTIGYHILFVKQKQWFNKKSYGDRFFCVDLIKKIGF